MKVLALVVTLAVSMQLNLGSDVPMEVPPTQPPNSLMSAVSTAAMDVIEQVSAAWLHYIIPCVRFPRDTYPVDVTPDGPLHYPGPLYHPASYDSLKNSASFAYADPSYGSEEDLQDYQLRASSSTFHFYSYDAQLLRKGAMYFTLVIGLMIIYFAFVLTESKDPADETEEQSEKERPAIEANNGEGLTLMQRFFASIDRSYVQLLYHARVALSLVKAIAFQALKYLATLVLVSQQALVLLPLTAISAITYCLTTIYTICQYKFTAWTISLVLIHLPIGVFGYRLARRSDDKSVKFLGAYVAMYCVVVLLIYIVYYMLAGVVVGDWFESQFHLVRPFVVSQLVSLALFLSNDILAFYGRFCRPASTYTVRTSTLVTMECPQAIKRLHPM